MMRTNSFEIGVLRVGNVSDCRGTIGGNREGRTISANGWTEQIIQTRDDDVRLEKRSIVVDVMCVFVLYLFLPIETSR